MPNVTLPKDAPSELQAMKAAMTALSQRIETMSRKDAAKPDMTEEEAETRAGAKSKLPVPEWAKKTRSDDDAPVELSEIASMLKLILRHLGEDGEEGEADDDGRRKDRGGKRRRRDDTKPEEPEPTATAGDDDDPAAMAEARQRCDSAALMNGVSIERPRIGDSVAGFMRRAGTQLQRLAPKSRYHNADLNLVSDKRTLREVFYQIADDATAAAYDPQTVPAGTLREVVETDRTGRRLTRFVGSPTWLDTFSLPVQRARFDRRKIERAEDRMAAGRPAP